MADELRADVHSAETRRPKDDPGEWFGRSVAARDGLTAKLRAKNFEPVLVALSPVAPGS